MGDDFTRVPRGPSHGGDIEAQVRALNDHAHDVQSAWRGLNRLIATVRTTANNLATALPLTYQPLDADLTAIAALTTTAYGRAFLALADAAAARTAIGLSSKYHYVMLAFIAAANTTSAVLTTHPSTAEFLCGSDRNVQKIDLTHFTDCRMTARVTTGSASANSPRLRVRFNKNAFSTTLSDYSDIGATETACSLTSTGLIDSGWVALDSLAKNDIWVTIEQVGGDGAANPAVGQLQIHFRGVNTEV